jgi:MoxR-like ATPase
LDVTGYVNFRERLVESVSKAIVGKKDVIELAVYGLLVGGHVLFEDNPGLGKTTLAKAVAKAIGCDFRRVQFTADLLPSDVTGTFVLDSNNFRFHKGPVFTQVLLADEINRAPPKTQSALLEAMQEHQVTAENQTFPLPSPFMVFATQNPIEYEGTYPLPEAQMDRFTIRLRMGYPSFEDEVKVVGLRKVIGDELAPVTKEFEPQDLLALQSAVDDVFIDDDIKRYIVRLVSETRSVDGVEAGSSPRGSIQLSRMGRAKAACSGRAFVTPDDIKELAVPVLAHRIVLAADAQVKGVSQASVIQGVLKRVPVPKVSGSEE